MKISHSDLEACRRNPRQWVSAKLFSDGSGPRYGYNQAIKNAIYTYHRTSIPADSKKYLAEALKKFTNIKRSLECSETLESYLQWAEAYPNVFASWRIHLKLILHRDILLGGEISRVDIDIKVDQYMAIILGPKPMDWKDQLRIPLIQYAIASQFHRPVDQVRVGYQDINGSDLQTTQCDETDIREALKEGRKIGIAVHGEVTRQMGNL